MTAKPTPPSVFFDAMAELEASHSFGVGGFLADHGMLRGVPQSELPGMAFGKLVELWRRSKGWTLEKLSQESEVGMEELLLIEHGLQTPPQPRAVFQIAKVTEIPVGKLMELSGLAVPRDAQVQTAALRFAAQSESMDKLSEQESAALHDLIHSLSDAVLDRPHS